MSMTDEQFEDFLDYCYSNLEDKQSKLIEEYGISNFDEYFYSQENKVLQFKSDGEVKLEFNVVFIGSWARNSNSWMWAWANKSMLDEVKLESAKIKELENVTGFNFFSQPSFECDGAMAHELTAFAVEQLNAKGMYISPNSNAQLFMAIISESNK